MASRSPLVQALRATGDRPVMVADGRSISGSELLAGAVPEGGLPAAVAARLAGHLAIPAWETDPFEQRLRHWAGILGPPPIRHTVLYPASELGADLALATLYAGGTVVCGDPEQLPAGVLADLARRRTTHLSLPSQLLWRISRLSGPHSYDLAELRRVIHIGPEPRQDDVYAAVEALGTVPAHVREPSSCAEAADDTLREVIGAAAAEAWKHVIGVTGEQVRRFTEHLDNAVLASMLLALRTGRVLTDPTLSHPLSEILAAARVVPAHRRLVERWLEVLTEGGLTFSDGESFRAVQPVETAAALHEWRLASEAWNGQLGSAVVMDYLRRSAERLPALLAGELDAASLLFPKGSIRITHALEANTATGRYLTTALSTAVRQIAVARTAPGALRVLEMGAGTGVTTEAIARVLAAEGRPGPAVDYLCTESSELLLGAARARGGKHARVRFKHFDVHSDPGGQGFRPHSFDVVIAANTLAGARDPDAAARRLTGLLAPGGWLLLTEPTREHHEFLISRALLPLGIAEDARLTPGGTPPSATGWREALAGAGVGTVLTLPGEDHPLTLLGHQLFAARVT
ncbi:methyltransferase [Kitasatospora sp. NPDC085464]|uniref:methyltransferase n=1 Tax=Kitasatospora sp. NPDC085464 TaxID=3364063 RepID=UPI0037C8CE00